MKVKALFDYLAQAPNQISLQRGKVYECLHNGGPGGWSKAQDESGI